MSVNKLFHEHYAMLSKGSGISDEVIAARGYCTITEPKELLELGFSSKQSKNVPGLLLPVCPPDGSNGLYTYRPDLPRLIESRKQNSRDNSSSPRIIKYEMPKGMSVRLDCSPVCRSMLADPTIPLWITEGQKKADALASHNLCAVDLLGVWSFKGKNVFGGVTLLADFDCIAFNNRAVRIVFDSDVMTKREVQQALARLIEHLKRKGAQVAAVYLPSVNGQKVGVDDYLLVHDSSELEGLIDNPQPMPHANPPVIELLDYAPTVLRRPLALIEDMAYAAIWPYVKTTITETIDDSGNITRYDPPLVTTQQRLVIVRSDGALFGDGSGEPIEKLSIKVELPEIPPQEKLWSTPGMRAYQEGKRLDAADVFNRIVDVVDRFIDFDRSLADQRTMTELVACYILATWFLPAFTVIGFLWPTGERGSGKTQLLSIVTELAYLGQMILAGGSYASLRDLADYGATLCFDDTENLADPKRTDPDKRALLLAGNRRGNTVTVKELGLDRIWRTRHVNTFCPRLFSAIRLPDPVLASRTIVMPLVRTCDRFKANADPLNYTLWPHDRRKLIDDLWALGLANLADLPHYEEWVNEKAKLMGRNLEPWRPLLAVAAWLEKQDVRGIWRRIERLSVRYQQERQDLESTDVTPLVIRAICRCLDPSCDVLTFCDVLAFSSDTQKQFLKTSQISQAVREIAEEQEDGIDTDHLSDKRIGWILKKLRMDKAREAGTGKRGWHISKSEMQRWINSFGLYTSEKTSQTSETSQSEDELGTREGIASDGGEELISPPREKGTCDCCGSAVVLVAGEAQCESCGIHLRYDNTVM